MAPRRTWPPQYYSQRADGGPDHHRGHRGVEAGAIGAYMNTPGMYTDRHQQKWARDRRRRARRGRPDVRAVVACRPDGAPGHQWRRDGGTVGGRRRHASPTPRRARSRCRCRARCDRRDRGDRRGVPRAARRAVDAGMDGVEIHCGQRLSAAPVPLRRRQPAHRRLRRIAREPRAADRRGRRGRRRRDRRGPGRAAHLAGKHRGRHARDGRGQRVRGAAGPHRAVATSPICTC